MRIVKLSSLSEEQRKKVLEEQEERYQQNLKERQNLQKQASDDFIGKFGNGVTQTSHTTTYKNILDSMESKNARKDFRKRNGLTLWDQVKTLAGDFERFDQNVGESMTNGIRDFFTKIQKARIEERKQKTEMMYSVDELLKNSNNENMRELAEKGLEAKSNRLKKIEEEIDNLDLKNKEKREKSQKLIEKNISNQSNDISKKIAELGASAGNMMVGSAISSVNPVLGFAYFTGSASESYYQDALERGMTKEQAKKYGDILGALEGATEMIGIDNLKKAGMAAKTLFSGTGKAVLKEAAAETIKKESMSVLKNFGIGVADNFMQEAIMEPLQEATAQTVGGEDKANWENMWGRMFNAGLDGAYLYILTGGAEVGVDSCIGISEKLQRGESVTQKELQQAVKDAQDAGVDTKKITEDNLIQARDLLINEIKQNSQEEITQNTDNKVINQENKIAQNGLSQAENDIKTQTKNNLAKVKQFYDENTYNQMQQFIESAPSQEALNQINEDIKTETKNKLEEAYKSERFTESQDRKRTYAKYQRENRTNGIQYNNEVVNNALDTVAPNRNGRRTVGQWKQVAEQIGLNSVDLTKSQIDDIAYGSWFELEPNKNITQYDNRTKEHKGFEKFTSDDWINTIYESAKGQKLQQLDTLLSNNVANNQEMLYNSSNERESDINEGNIEGHTIERGNRIYEKGESQQIKNREYNWDEYNKWEKSIKPVTESNLTSEERQSINKAKQEHNKDVLLYDENDNDNTYSGGASRDTKNKITISRQQAETFGLDKMIYHENVESDIIHNDAARDILSPIVELIKEDENFNKQKENFWKGQKNNIPSDDLIAKDILCDRFSEMKSGEKVDYDNVLTNSTNSNIDMALNNYYKQVYGKELEQSSSFNLQQKQENTQNTKGETINWNEIERPEENKKFRKHYRSIIESSNTTAEAKAIAKELMGTDTYVPETNKGQLAQADQRIMTSSPETELQSLLSKAMNGEKITSVDIAVGERLIQYFSKTGNKQQLQEAIQATALAGTSAGQTVQALALLNHQTPQGQATWIQRSVDKMNKELAKRKGGTITTDVDGNIQVINKQGQDITDKVDLFNLTPEMIDKIMNSENQEQMYKNIDEVYEELGQQVPKSMIEKIDSWRYFSMLANARTHIRNMVGNVAMGKMQRVKDKIAGGIEGVVSKFNPEMERTKTLAVADKKTKNFAKQDFKNMEVQSRLELNENKYNPQSRLQNARRTFKSDVMENTLGRLFNLNDTLLEAEDGLGLKAGYQKALADYLTANKIDVDNITDTQLNKARNYAIQQAKEATFHQANAIASAITQFENKNLATKLFTGAVLPFKKTPMNVAKAGMEYSPLQIAKSATLDIVNLRKGNISINQYIDNLSKGLTGTGIALVGYALANAGILKASGGDDKDKEKYDEEQGKQSYSIEIGGKTYSLDWLAPTGIPLFVGAETYKLFNQENNEKSTEKTSEEDKLNQAIKGATNLLNAGATAINPMSEMSMISGLTSALSSYNTSDNLGSLGNILTNAGKSYINQFVPTAMGQLAKTTDEYERTTKSTAKGTLGKAIDQTKNQIMNKIPGLRQKLPIKTDIWGKEAKQEVNLPLRALNNFVNPATVKNVSIDEVDKELNKLYEVNSNKSILPDILTKTLQIDGEKYRLTNKEYAEYTKKYGQNSYNLINNLINTNEYKKLTQEQKEEAISNIYSYTKEKNKIDYAKKVNREVKPSTLYTTMEELKNNGGKQNEYLSYLSKIKGLEKESEKNKILAKSNYSNKTKEAIYINGTGKDDKLYNKLLSKSNINMTEYLNYKNKVADKAFKADKDKNGKTVANKLYNYLNDNISGANNRLLIAGKSYTLKNSEKHKLAKYINEIANTKEEKIEMFKQLSKNFKVKDGKVYMKISKN